MFRSESYAVAFARDNRRNLINVSGYLYQLLEGELARATAAPPMVHLAAAKEPSGKVPRRNVQTGNDLVLGWIAKIESYKGPEARRAALQHALAEVHGDQGRYELVAAAMRIELAAVVDKVDRLKTPAAKRRHLLDAAERFRTEAMPERVRAECLGAIEGHLRRV